MPLLSASSLTWQGAGLNVSQEKVQRTSMSKMSGNVGPFLRRRRRLFFKLCLNFFMFPLFLSFFPLNLFLFTFSFSSESCSRCRRGPPHWAPSCASASAKCQAGLRTSAESRCFDSRRLFIAFQCISAAFHYEFPFIFEGFPFPLSPPCGSRFGSSVARAWPWRQSPRAASET